MAEKDWKTKKVKSPSKSIAFQLAKDGVLFPPNGIGLPPLPDKAGQDAKDVYAESVRMLQTNIIKNGVGENSALLQQANMAHDMAMSWKRNFLQDTVNPSTDWVMATKLQETVNVVKGTTPVYPYCNNSRWFGIQLAKNPVSDKLAEDIFRAFASVCNTQVDVEKACTAKRKKGKPTSFQEVYGDNVIVFIDNTIFTRTWGIGRKPDKTERIANESYVDEAMKKKDGVLFYHMTNRAVTRDGKYKLRVIEEATSPQIRVNSTFSVPDSGCYVTAKDDPQQYTITSVDDAQTLTLNTAAQFKKGTELTLHYKEDDDTQERRTELNSQLASLQSENAKQLAAKSAEKAAVEQTTAALIADLPYEATHFVEVKSSQSANIVGTAGLTEAVFDADEFSEATFKIDDIEHTITSVNGEENNFNFLPEISDAASNPLQKLKFKYADERKSTLIVEFIDDVTCAIVGTSGTAKDQQTFNTCAVQINDGADKKLVETTDRGAVKLTSETITADTNSLQKWTFTSTVGKMRHEYETKLASFRIGTQKHNAITERLVELQAFVHEYIDTNPDKDSVLRIIEGQSSVIDLGTELHQMTDNFTASEAEQGVAIANTKSASKYGRLVHSAFQRFKEDNPELVDILAFRGGHQYFYPDEIKSGNAEDVVGEFERAFYEANRNRGNAVRSRVAAQIYFFSLLMWYSGRLFNCTNAFDGVVARLAELQRDDRKLQSRAVRSYREFEASLELVFPARCFGRDQLGALEEYQTHFNNFVYNPGVGNARETSVTVDDEGAEESAFKATLPYLNSRGIAAMYYLGAKNPSFKMAIFGGKLKHPKDPVILEYTKLSAYVNEVENKPESEVSEEEKEKLEACKATLKDDFSGYDPSDDIEIQAILPSALAPTSTAVWENVIAERYFTDKTYEIFTRELEEDDNFTNQVVEAFSLYVERKMRKIQENGDTSPMINCGPKAYTRRNRSVPRVDDVTDILVNAAISAKVFWNAVLPQSTQQMNQTAEETVRSISLAGSAVREILGLAQFAKLEQSMMNTTTEGDLFTIIEPMAKLVKVFGQLSKPKSHEDATANDVSDMTLTFNKAKERIEELYGIAKDMLENNVGKLSNADKKEIESLGDIFVYADDTKIDTVCTLLSKHHLELTDGGVVYASSTLQSEIRDKQALIVENTADESVLPDTKARKHLGQLMHLLFFGDAYEGSASQKPVAAAGLFAARVITGKRYALDELWVARLPRRFTSKFTNKLNALWSSRGASELVEQADENAMHVLDQMVDNFIVESERHALEVGESYERLGMDKHDAHFLSRFAQAAGDALIEDRLRAYTDDYLYNEVQAICGEVFSQQMGDIENRANFLNKYHKEGTTGWRRAIRSFLRNHQKLDANTSYSFVYERLFMRKIGVHTVTPVYFHNHFFKFNFYTSADEKGKTNAVDYVGIPFDPVNDDGEYFMRVNFTATRVKGIHQDTAAWPLFFINYTFTHFVNAISDVYNRIDLMSTNISDHVEELKNILPAFRGEVERFVDAAYFSPETMGRIATEIYNLCLILLQDFLFADANKSYADVKDDAGDVVTGSSLVSDGNTRRFPVLPYKEYNHRTALEALWDTAIVSLFDDDSFLSHLVGFAIKMYIKNNSSPEEYFSDFSMWTKRAQERVELHRDINGTLHDWSLYYTTNKTKKQRTTEAESRKETRRAKSLAKETFFGLVKEMAMETIQKVLYETSEYDTLSGWHSAPTVLFNSAIADINDAEERKVYDEFTAIYKTHMPDQFESKMVDLNKQLQDYKSA